MGNPTDTTSPPATKTPETAARQRHGVRRLDAALQRMSISGGNVVCQTSIAHRAFRPAVSTAHAANHALRRTIEKAASSRRSPWRWRAAFGAFLGLVCALTSTIANAASPYETTVRPFLAEFCIDCHGGKKVKGKVDFTKIRTQADLDAQFETWEAAIARLREGDMPPDAAKQPPAGELLKIYEWYQARFVETVEAKPAVFQPRRLSAHEYRNTLRSLFGFDLDVAIIEAEQTLVEKSLVMKLLPEDPPGKSGFKNDTSGNPLTTDIWNQYAYLIDTALEELFSPKRRKELETMAGPIGDGGFSRKNAEALIRHFVPRAHRRSVPEALLTAGVSQLGDGKELIPSLRAQMKQTLMSPAFIYRGILVDSTAAEAGAVVDIDAFELAERLSYFIWADMPDSELMRLAKEGKLSDPAVFKAQVHRLLDSPKSRNLAEDFALQWLALTEIDQFRAKQIPLADALKSQPIDFIHYLFADDRPLMEFIDSEITFINPHTAKFYPKDRSQMPKYQKQKGIEQESVPNHRITLKNTEGRGGLLTMPGVVAMNKGPVLRGTWMLERILGEHLPDPPANVGQVQPNKRGEKLTFRQRFEQHRSNPTCASCHDKIDPLGFALQGYDAQGAYILAKGYKPTKRGRKKPTPGPVNNIDTSGRLPSGETFADFEELKQILLTGEKERVIRNIVKRTLSYALARKLEIHDQPVVEEIVTELNQSNGTWRDLILAIASSLPFRKTVVGGE